MWSFFSNPKKWCHQAWQDLRFWYDKKKQRSAQPLPRVCHPYDDRIKTRQKNILITFLLSLVVVGMYSYLYVSQQVKKYDLVSVYIAKQDLKAPKILKKEDVVVERFPQKNVPAGALTHWKPEKVLVRDVLARSVLNRLDFQSDINPKSVSTHFQDLFAFAIDEGWFVSRFPNIHRYDRVDIISGNPGGGIVGTSVLIEYAEVLEVRTVKGTRSITLNLTKSQAQSLLFARSLRLPLQILVYPAGSSAPLEIDSEKLGEQPLQQPILNSDDLDV